MNLGQLVNKKILVLKFIFGNSNLKKEIVLDPENMPIVFGRSEKNAEAGN